VISVALKTPLQNKIGNLYLQNITSASARWPDDYICFTPSFPPHFTTKLLPWWYDLITYGCFCSGYTESMRPGQLQLVKCDVFKTTTVV